MEDHASRRQLLKMTMASVAAMAATPVKMFAYGTAPDFPAPKTPDEAVQMLLDGNERYLTHKPGECVVDLAELRHASEEKQKPFAAILTCADSRVPVELIFDQSIGQLFVVRVAGNIATPDTIASLEYAVAVLNVKTIMVLGHTNCGAVTAAKHGGSEPGAITALFQYIYPATLGTSGPAEAIEKNAKVQAAIVTGASTVISQNVKDGNVGVKAALYNVGTGKVTLLPALSL